MVAMSWLTASIPAQLARFTLPAETAAFPAGPAGELLTQRCTACHSADLVTRQPPLTAEKWQATVTKMREVYRAPLDPAQDGRLVAALLAVQNR